MSILSAISKIVSIGGGSAGRKAAGKILGKSAKGGAVGLGGKLGYDALKGIMSSNDNNKNQASNDNTPSNLTRSMGMAGSAGRQSTSSATMPSFTSTPAVRASANASQRDLLSIAVKLLGSIDASIKEQNKQQRFIASQQQLQQRESQVEMSGGVASRVVGGMGSRLASKARGPLESIISNALLGITAYALFNAKSMSEIANGAFEMVKTVGGVLAGTGLVVSAARGGKVALGELAEKFNPKSQRYHVSEGPNKGRFFKPDKAAEVTKGALKGVLKAGAKGGLIGAAFEALGYVLDPSSMTGRNLAGSLGTIIGGGLGAILGSGLFSVATGIAGGYAGHSIGTGLYDLIAGPPIASGQQVQVGQQVEINDPTIKRIMETIKMRESGGNYSEQNPSGSASGAYQFIDSTWKSLTAKYRIGTEYPKAKLAPPEIQDAVAAKYIEEILKANNGDISKVPLVWYTGNNRGQMSAAAVKANNGLTPQAYQARWMENFNNSSTITAGAGVYGASATMGDGALAAAQFETFVKGVTDKIPATNLMSTPLGPQKSFKDTIDQQAAAMETAARTQNRAEKLAVQSITRPQAAQQVALTNSGGAQSVPSPGYGVAGDGDIIDMLVYFGLAKAA